MLLDAAAAYGPPVDVWAAGCVVGEMVRAGGPAGGPVRATGPWWLFSGLLKGERDPVGALIYNALI